MDRRSRSTLTRRTLTDWFNLRESVGQPVDGKPPLRVDREKGIIYGVKVCGRYSPNNHGVREADGTEYTVSAWHSEAKLIDGIKTYAGHPPDRNPTAERDPNDANGVLRNPFVIESGENPGLFADWHGLPSDPVFVKAMDDVEKGLGVYGLSHNARWGKSEVKNRRLTIETMEAVNSVDVVTKPATNSNLWESREKSTVKYTLKSILESHKKTLSAPRIKWATYVLETMDDGVTTAETDEMPVDAEPEDAMKAAFMAAGSKILTGMFDGSIDDVEGFKKLKELHKAHGKLTQTAEPDEPAAEESEDDDDDDDDKKKAAESVELATLRKKDAVRTLCEREKFVPDDFDMKTMCALESDADRKKYIAKNKGGSTGRPRSGGPALESRGGGNGDNLPTTAEQQLAILRR